MLNLAIDTKILVKEFRSDKWQRYHFKQWGHRTSAICFESGKTSFSSTGGTIDTRWVFWKIAEGKYKGINNLIGGE